jgi:hypothetical protein
MPCLDPRRFDRTSASKRLVRTRILEQHHRVRGRVSGSPGLRVSVGVRGKVRVMVMVMVRVRLMVMVKIRIMIMIKVRSHDQWSLLKARVIIKG